MADFIRVAEGGYSGDSGNHIYVEYRVNSQSVSTNSSNITIQLVGYNTGSGYPSYNSSSAAQLYVNSTLSASNGSLSFNYSGTDKQVFLSNTFDVGHDGNGNFSFTLTGAHQTGVGCGNATASGTVTLTQIPRGGAMLDGVRPFTDEEDPIMSPAYTYPSGSGYKCYWWLEYDPIGIGNRNIEVSVNPNINPWDWHLTEAQRNDIRSHSASLNRLPVRIGYQVKNGSTIMSTDYRDFYCDVVNADPSAPEITVTDTNSQTTALTGAASSTIIKGYSNIQIAVSAKASGKKYATISKYRFACGSKTTYVAESTSAVSAALTGVESGNVTVTAIDSRGNTNTVSTTLSLVDYKPVLLKTMSLTRGSGGVGTSVTLSFTGFMWSGSFGSASNAVSAITYQYREKGTENWTLGTTELTYTVSGTTVSGSTVVGDFDATKIYEFQMTLSDALSASSISGVVGPGRPAFKVGEDGSVTFRKDGLYVEDMAGLRESIFLAVYPVGIIIETESDMNPGDKWGGTWELHSKGRVLLGADSDHPVKSTGGKSTHSHTQTMNFTASYINGNGLKYTNGEAIPQSVISTGTASSMMPYASVYRWIRTA